MNEFFVKLFDTDFMPHVVCLRTPPLIWMHAVSDGLIAMAYFLIPLGLMRLVQKRRDLAFHWLFILFAVFILSCGATHVMSIVTLWHPIYRFDGLLKIITAASSLLTAFLLIHLIPRIALLPSPEQWRLSNEELKAEIGRRETVEAEMRSMNAQLEERVAQRTNELERQNITLQELKAAWDLAHGLIRETDGKITFWCEGSEQLYGWKKHEAVGVSSHQLLKTQFPKPLVDIERELKEQGSWSGELVHSTKWGASLQIATHWVLRNHNSDDGAAVSVIEVNNDITDRLRAEEAVRISEERQRLAVDAGRVGLWYVDVKTGRRIFNQRFRELHGISTDEMLPDYPTPLTVIHAEDRPAVEEAVRKAMEGSAEIEVEYRTRGLDFRMKWIQCRGRAQRDANGRVTGIHGTVIDLTERRQMENTLRRMNTELEQFAYAAAHDLQEPLRNVALSAALLEAEAAERLAPNGRPLLNTLIENSRRMEAMVKDLLSYSRALECSEDQPASTEGDAVLQQALQNLETTIREKRACISFDALPKISMRTTHLLQIFQNLIGNSLKYSGDQPLKIHVGAEIRSEDVVLFVTDNGIGIAPQFHDRAFGMFKRLHRGSVTGTGIGLAVCKRIVEHYGGRIWIESQLGEGATFRFNVPKTSVA